MRMLPSKLFPGCALPPDQAAGFYDTIPQGFEHKISLYLSKETVRDNDAINKAAGFFDRVGQWNFFCRNRFASLAEDSEDYEMIREYFCFYQEEVPEVFGVSKPSALTLPEMVSRLALCQMASHGAGAEQYFTVDFTLGYDQLLSVYFNGDSSLDHLAWES